MGSTTKYTFTRALFTLAALTAGSLNAAVAQQPPTEVIFRQPTLSGISHDMVHPAAGKERAGIGVFQMVLWQKNPERPDGRTVPVTWDAGERTGLHAAQRRDSQFGFADARGSTTVQISGDEVGAYVNSGDIEKHGACEKIMATPQYTFPPASKPYPFIATDGALNISLDLQVPTAVAEVRKGSLAYVTADVEFVDQTSGTRISNGIWLFSLGNAAKSRPMTGYDVNSHSFMMNTPLRADGPWAHPLPGSAFTDERPWTGYRTFKFQIDHDGFRKALLTLKASRPDQKLSVDPKDYAFYRFHLNAEISCTSAHAELGWSMKGLQFALAKAAR